MSRRKTRLKKFKSKRTSSENTQRKLDKLKSLKSHKATLPKKSARSHNLLSRKFVNFLRAFWRKNQLKSIFKDF
jgi:hypothetical protein